MTPEKFEHIMEETYEKSRNVLAGKRQEYTPDTDRLANFKFAADLQSCSSLRALGGMMAKHIISVYDYIDRAEKGEKFTEKQWDEKVIDVINYMILLKGIVVENESKAALLDKEGVAP